MSDRHQERPGPQPQSQQGGWVSDVTGWQPVMGEGGNQRPNDPQGRWPGESRPDASRWGHRFIGEVRGIQQRSKSGRRGKPLEVWTFRIERYDQGGNRLPPVPVQMVGRSFRGILNEGDWVAVSGRRRGGTMFARKAEDQTTGAVFAAESHFPWAVITTAAGIMVLLAIAALAFNWFGHPLTPSAPPPTTGPGSPVAHHVLPPTISHQTTPSTHPTTAPTTGLPTRGAVTIRDFTFEPAYVQIAVGQTITWTDQQPGILHTVTSDDGSFNSKDMASGSTFSLTFPGNGTFSYHCTIHPRMHGVIVVGSGVPKTISPTTPTTTVISTTVTATTTPTTTVVTSTTTLPSSTT